MSFKWFAGLPTKPVFYLALILLAGVSIYHYGTSYQRCTGHAELRAKLRAAIHGIGETGPPARLRLSSVIGFAWDRADILVNYKPDGQTADCPFGWDWSEEERAALVAKDLLTVIVLSRDGKIVDYVEYRRDWGEFLDVRNPYTPETAVFDIRRSPAGRFGVVLTPAVTGVEETSRD